MLKEKRRRREAVTPYLRPDEEIILDVAAIFSEIAPAEGYFVVTNQRLLFVGPRGGLPAAIAYEDLVKVDVSPTEQGLAQLQLHLGDGAAVQFLTGERSCREIANQWLAFRAE